MIEVRGLKKHFGKLQVLKGVDLAVETGQITAILGPNGSGKTTLIKSILGLVFPNEGEIWFQDNLINGQYKYRNEIGYLPQIANFPENLKVEELFNMIQDIRGQEINNDTLVAKFQLEPYLKKRLRYLSGGTRQKINLTLTFMFDCPLYILDEPTSGLDPVAMIRLKDYLKEKRKQGHTFLITTHIIKLVEEIADELVFLLEGKIYFKGSYSELTEMENEENLERAIANILEKS